MIKMFILFSSFNVNFQHVMDVPFNGGVIKIASDRTLNNDGKARDETPKVNQYINFTDAE